MKTKLLILIAVFAFSILHANQLVAHGGGHGSLEMFDEPTVESMTQSELWKNVNDSVLLVEDSVKRNALEEIDTVLVDLKDALAELQKRAGTKTNPPTKRKR